MTQRDVQAIVTLLRRLQRDFWPQGWKYKQIDELIAKLRASVSRRGMRGRIATSDTGVQEHQI